MDEALAQQADFISLIKSYGGSEDNTDYSSTELIDDNEELEEPEDMDESLGQDIGRAGTSDQLDDMYFDELNQVDMSSYDFMNKLVLGEIDGYAMGEAAIPIYDAYGTTDTKKVNQITENGAAKYNQTVQGDFSSIIASHESKGNNPYQALPKRKDGSLVSSAAGKYQFLWNKHNPWIKKQTGIHSKQEFLDSPEAQEKAFAHWERTTLDPLADKYEKQLPQYAREEIKMMLHFGGEGNVQKAIRDNNFKKPLDGFGSSLESYIKKKQYGGISEMAYGGEPPKKRYTFQETSPVASDATRTSAAKDKPVYDAARTQGMIDHENDLNRQMAGMAPVLGTALDVQNMVTAAKKGDLTGTLVSGALLTLQSIPVGRMIGKGASLIKKYKKLKTAIPEIARGDAAIASQYATDEAAERLIKLENEGLWPDAQIPLEKTNIDNTKEYFRKRLEKPTKYDPKGKMTEENQGVYYSDGYGDELQGSYINSSADDYFSTTIHEKTHQISDGIANYLPIVQNALKKPFKVLKDAVNSRASKSKLSLEDQNYYKAPHEVHARINEIRHQINPDDPYKQVSINDWNRIVKTSNGNVRNMLGLIEDRQSFINLMNKMYTPAAVVATGAAAASQVEEKKYGGFAKYKFGQ